MKKTLLFVTATLFCISSVLGAQSQAEEHAFEIRYGLWKNVQCVSDSVRVNVDFSHEMVRQYAVDQLQEDMRADLTRLGVPVVCRKDLTPKPATLAAVVLEVQTAVDEKGVVVYFVRLQAEMPDADFVKTVFNQRTAWQSAGELGQVVKAHSRAELRTAVTSQVEEFATFLQKVKTLQDS